MFAALTPLNAADYEIDTKNAHAFIQFKIKHLGYSWLIGEFKRFDGTFSYAENNSKIAKVDLTIDVASIDSNHADRDKHLRSDAFLDTNKYPTAKFISTSYKELANGKGVLKGNFTLHGVTKNVTIEINKIGNGPDPWGGYRQGFEGSTKLFLKDFGINYDLGPASHSVEIYISVEGIRKK